MRRISELTMAAALVVVLPTVASAAPFFNIDIENSDALPQHGSGAPSPGFGAAANQPGHWNTPLGYDAGPYPLLDLSGSATTASMTTSDSIFMSSLAYLNTTNTGDYALLFNDASQVGTTSQGGVKTYIISGMTPGNYMVYTYAVAPQGTTIGAMVDVFGSTSTNPQTVTGPMPGNAFAFGITHSIHDVTVTSSGLLTIQVSIPPNQSAGAFVNGFQITPEPGSLSLLALGGVMVLRRRHGRRKGRQAW